MTSPDSLAETRLRQLNGMWAEISPEELRRKIENGEIIRLIEVSDADSFRAGHINGAIHAELRSVAGAAAQGGRCSQQLVVYTSDGDSSAARLAAASLQRAGWSNVLVLKGGKQAWRSKGYLLVD